MTSKQNSLAKAIASAPVVEPLDMSPQSLEEQEYSSITWPEDPPAKPEDARGSSPNYPIEGLGPLIGPAVADVANSYKVPVPLAAQGALATASLATQGFADVCIDGRVCPISLMILTGAPSGARKTAIDRIFNGVILEKERQKLTEFLIQEKKYFQELREWEAALKQQKTKTKGASKADFSDRPTPPVAPYLIFSDATVEGVHKALAVGCPSQAMINAEGGTFLGGFAMSKEQIVRTAACLSESWDGTPISRVRAAEGAVKLFGRRLTIALAFQPDVSETSIFSNEILINQGLLSRCLVTQPLIDFGSRSYESLDISKIQSFKNFETALRHALEQDLPLELNSANTLKPRLLALSPEAKKIWIEFYNGVETRMADGGELSSIRGWASKAPENVLRLAAVLTLFCNVYAPKIDATEIKNAIKLIGFYEAEALRLIGVSGSGATANAAIQLLFWLRKNNKKKITRKMLQKSGPRNLRDVRRLEPALSELIESGWLQACPLTKNTYFVHPSAFGE